MLVIKIMQVLKNLFGLNKKIAASEIVMKNVNNEPAMLDEILTGIETYSEEEQVIGNYNGKLLYRKMMHLTSPSSGQETKIAVLTDVLDLIRLDAHIINSVNAQVRFPYIFNSSNFGMLWYNTSEKGIYCLVNNTAYQNKEITAIIAYTKTTD